MADSEDMCAILDDLDIDEDIPIEIENEFNDYESTEVEFPDDLLLENLDEETLKLLDSEVLVQIPTAERIVDEQPVPEQPQQQNPTNLLKCCKCSKIYKKKKSLQKHETKCGMFK